MAESPKKRGRWDLAAGFNTLLTLLTTNWVLALSALAAIAVATFQVATDFVMNPHTQAGFIAFVVCLWTLMGLVFLADRRTPRETKAMPDFEWGLAWENTPCVLDPVDDEATLHLGITVRNMAGAPLSYRFEHLEVRIGARSMKIRNQITPITVPKVQTRNHWCDPFPKKEIADFIGKKTNGIVEFSVVYGPFGLPPTRRLTMRLEGPFILAVMQGENEQIVASGASFGGRIMEEMDQPI